jgi:hypothetical protein
MNEIGFVIIIYTMTKKYILLLMYGKNVQEDLTMEEKKNLKRIVSLIKEHNE